MNKRLLSILQGLVVIVLLGVLSYGYLIPVISRKSFFNPVLLCLLYIFTIMMYFISFEKLKWYHYIFIPFPLLILFGNMFRIIHWSYGKELVWVGLAGGVLLFVLLKIMERRSNEQQG